MKESEVIANVVKGWFEAAQKGDVSWRDNHVSKEPNIRIVGTDPKEWLTGREAYEFLKNEAEAVGGKLKAEINDVEGYEEGTVGWGTARVTLTLPDGRTASPRWSGVFHQEDGQWKLVHLHASLGISNEQAFGEVFPGVKG